MHDAQTLSSPCQGLLRHERRITSFLMLLAIAWALAASVLIADHWAETAERLFDTDDAMRLVEMRDFLAGRGWFDLHESRLDPPGGYDTHWSRLIDAGLAGLILMLRPFTDPEMAERLMRTVWPLLWLGGAMGAVAAISWRLAGRNAAVVALLIAALALPGFQHFKPGRIDHHNVQIVLALAVLATAAWSDRSRHAATLAGIFTGLAAGIGLENVLFVALCGAGLTTRFVLSAQGASPLARYGAGVALATPLAFFAVVAPAHWGAPVCDAIAINWLIPAMIAGVCLCIIGTLFANHETRTRLFAVGAVAAVSGVAFVWIDPTCLRGPFAEIDPVVKSLWLDHVDEMEPLVSFVRGFPMIGAWLCAFPLIAMLAALALGRDAVMQRTLSFWLTVAVLALSIAATFGAVKVYSYAMWFGMPLVAALIARLVTANGPRATLARLAAAFVLTPTVVTAGAITIAHAAIGPDPAKPGVPERTACSRNDAYGSLAALPAGLVATEINYGPFVLALTPHSVLAAPYHRVSGGIIAAHTILAEQPEKARRVIERYGVAYVAICGSRAPQGVDATGDGLWAELSRGHAPSWLTRLPSDGLFAIYRVLR